MKQSLAWIEKFIPSDKQNEIALLSSEKQFEALCKLIESGQIEASNYLSWASQFFLLPSLDSQFFVKVDIKQVWQKYSALKLWSPEILPVGEWENRVMIACVSPPTEFNMSSVEPPVFVLASPLDLKRTWGQLHKKAGAVEAPVQVKPAPPTTAPMPVAIADQTPVSIADPTPVAEAKNPLENTVTRFELKMDADFKPIDFGTAASEKESTEEPEVLKAESKESTQDSPAFTFDLDITSSKSIPNFNFGPPKIDKKEEAPKEAVESDEFKLDLSPQPETPKPLAPNPVAQKSTASPIVQKQAPEKAAPSPFPPPPPPPMRMASVPLPKPPVTPAAPSPQAPAPVTQAPTAASAIATSSTELSLAQPATPLVQMKPMGPPIQNKPIGPPPKAIQPPTPFKVAVVEPIKAIPTPAPQKVLSAKSGLKRKLDKVKSSFEECSNYEDLSDLMFSKMSSHFEMSMLVRCEEAGLVTVYWAGDFKVADEQKPSVIGLQQPSIFKVVYGSGKPYHGYVVANPTNTKFFTEWNSGEIPKHVTVFPVFVEKDLVAMWIGATNKAVDLKVSLADLDSFTDSCVASFHKALKSAA